MIAKGAGYLILVPLIIGVVMIALSVQLASYVIYIAANVFFLISVVIIIIFRDPPRDIGRGVVSPADGKVIHVNRNVNSMSISTALHRVHVNRIPLSGRVMGVKRSLKDRKGVEVSVATMIGAMRIEQKPRSMLRMVIPYVTEGQRIVKGRRIGIAVPNALVRVKFPKHVQITVKEGQNVIAGVTTVGNAIGAVMSRNSHAHM